jgi:hypothetical protein
LQILHRQCQTHGHHDREQEKRHEFDVKNFEKAQLMGLPAYPNDVGLYPIYYRRAVFDRPGICYWGYLQGSQRQLLQSFVTQCEIRRQKR